MAIQLSPGISVSEVDLTTTTPAVSTSTAAFAGVFSWGPVGRISQVISENVLVNRYGKPTNKNFESFFSGASFLSYSNNLLVSRAALTSGTSVTEASDLNGNTTILITDPSAAVVNGLGVYGAGIQDGTIVTNKTANATHTIVTISKAATLGNTTVASAQTINYFDVNVAYNAVANSSTAVDRNAYVIKNSDHFEDVGDNIQSGVEFIAKYPGELGNSLKVSAITSSDQHSSTINPYALPGYTNTSVIPGATTGLTLNVNSTTANIFISNSATLDFSTTYIAAGDIRSNLVVGDYIEVGNTSIGKQNLKIKSIGTLQNTNPLSPSGTTYFNVELETPYARSTNWTANTISRKWEYSTVIPSAPGNDELSIVVVDALGKFTGTAGSILDSFQNLSTDPDAKTSDGSSNYYKTVVNDNSRYIWSVNELPVSDVPYTKSFVGGSDGADESNISMGALAQAWDLFSDAKSVDIGLCVTGKQINETQLANYVIDNIAETRKDCVVFVSPSRDAVVGSNVDGSQVENVVEFRNSLRSTSFAFMDSGYKYMYDKYNDTFRWVPLNGDIAGLAARTDDTRDPWWSFAGFSRGQIKNVTKLAWNPAQAERDILYSNDINPVVNFQGQGTLLYGDKTTLGTGSAFSRVNVRRLFIVLEKSIAQAAEFALFEFNDEFTRAQFKNLTEPFLRDVKGRRGIQDFKVVCDETNNTPQVIDENRFVGDIYIKPSRSINWVQLNFINVRSGVSFNEITGGA